MDERLQTTGWDACGNINRNGPHRTHARKGQGAHTTKSRHTTKLQEALQLDQYVSLKEGLAELGHAGGIQAELKRLQGEIAKHQKSTPSHDCP